MSVEMLSHFYETSEYKKATPVELLVFGYLAYRHTDNQGCFPSLETIAQALGRTPQQISKAKKRLEMQGLVKVSKRGKGLYYEFPLYRRLQDKKERNPGVDNMTTAGCQCDNHKVDNMTTAGCQCDNHKVDNVTSRGCQCDNRYISDNNNEKKNESECDNARTHTREDVLIDLEDKDLLIEMFAIAEKQMGIPRWYMHYWLTEMTKAEWQTEDGDSVNKTNWQAVLNSWYSGESEKHLAEIKAEVEGGDKKRRESEAQKPRVLTTQDRESCDQRDGRPSCVPADDEAKGMARQIGVPETYLPKFFATMKSKGWGYVNRGGVQVNLNRSNFKSILGAFYGRENERSAKDTSLHTGHYELRLGKKKEESI